MEREQAKEREFAWKNCTKNSRHKKFIPVHDFIDSHLPYCLSKRDHENIRIWMDLTVRIRVSYTSQSRPDNDVLADYRGTNTPRLGTGFVHLAFHPQVNKPCPCDTCDWKIVRKYWSFRVFTASHVVYDTKEAKVDLFYDDEKSQTDGRMSTVRGVKVVWKGSSEDICFMDCVTHDERLANRILSLRKRLTSLDEYPDFNMRVFGERREHVLIISHPHGQPKKITIGKVIREIGLFDGGYYMEHHAATCPGSSGAPVFRFYRDRLFGGWPAVSWHVRRFVHGGTIKVPFPLLTGHINYGNHLHMFRERTLLKKIDESNSWTY